MGWLSDEGGSLPLSRTMCILGVLKSCWLEAVSLLSGNPRRPPSLRRGIIPRRKGRESAKVARSMAKRRAGGDAEGSAGPAAAAGPSEQAMADAADVAADVAAAVAVAADVEAAGKARARSGGNGNLTNYQRKLICEFYQRTGGVMSQKDLAQWTKHEFNLKKTPAQSTISGILRRQHEFTNMSTLELGIKKRRVVQHPELDNALANWVIQCAHRGITVQGDLTKEKAKHFARMLQIPEKEQPEFSNGWLHSFQLRHNFSFRKFNAENHHHHQSSAAAANAGLGAAATPDAKSNRRVIYFSTMEALVEETDKYLPQDIFAMDETIVLYTLPPMLNALQEAPMRAKKRFVAALAANADGSEKLQPLFVSHHDHPKCFKKKTADQHGLHYFWNHKAWMTGVIFSRWIQRLDFSMAHQKRQILLFLNEVASHVVSHLDLTNVVVFVLPAGASQMLNPITSGVLSTFKKRFRRHHLRYAIDRQDLTKNLSFDVDVLQAMKWATASWEEITSATITRAWMTTHLVRDRLTLDAEQSQEEDVFLDSELEHLLLFLRISDLMPVSEFLNDEALAESTVHEEFFDIVQCVGDVPEDEIDESVDESVTLGQSLSLQEKLKAFRDVLHVFKDRNEGDDNAITAIRRVHDAIRLEARGDENGADPMAELHATSSSELTYVGQDHVLDIGEPNGHPGGNSVSIPSLDAADKQTMDNSGLLESSESSALSVASAALAEATSTSDSTTSILDDGHVVHVTSVGESQFEAVL